LYGQGVIEARGWRNCLLRKICCAGNYFSAGGVFVGLTEFFINSHAKITNKTVQINVCHQGPIGIGNRAKMSHLRQPSFFHQKDGLLAGFFVATFCDVV
jgi:hypothetical protein